MGGGGGWAASSIQWYPYIYIYNVYIVCYTIFVSQSSCRLASTSIINIKIYQIGIS